MDKIKKYSIFKKFINQSSIESVLATVSVILFINRYFTGQYWTVVNTVQILSMWVLYLLDHLLDSLKTKSSSNSIFFFKQNFKYISLFIITLLFIIFYLLYFIDKKIIFFGLYLMFFCILYFILINNSKFPKEFFAALIYTLGCVGPVIINIEINNFIFLSFFLLYGTVFLNMILINILEYDQDFINNQKSLAINFGLKTTAQIFIIIYILQVILSIYLMFKFLPYSWQLLLISSIYLCIFIVNKYSSVIIKRKIIDYAFLLLLFF